ncbi:hypothetical protein [Bradyrhizobium sp. RT5a]|uniref:hypothetical protein n=1 Tax=Bradyrhizobium sp. RT5a TaxID=3156380 RepID=UPI0033921B8E
MTTILERLAADDKAAINESLNDSDDVTVSLLMCGSAFRSYRARWKDEGRNSLIGVFARFKLLEELLLSSKQVPVTVVTLRPPLLRLPGAMKNGRRISSAPAAFIFPGKLSAYVMDTSSPGCWR